ncbi:methyltransferase domain-containing protein [Stappia sp. GBMRC 2046]|uniref:Methyltransferase domain-containing protein n=1 Tax=Stappia sediminis TaxID=2692190 RepID=A0A7X3LS43_9HYPH|nr:class I SAM-dependent methyltransferase [Stappia sediminis]MXN64107.1 methyltransferase domain-containing protein [Stappia sediminis]
MNANQAQADYWSSSAGLKWIELEHALDTAMAGMLETMLDAAAIVAGERIVDVGCGTGASTIAAAARNAHGEVLGVDISKPLLERAEERARSADAGNVSFLLADAQSHRFADDAFDVLVSRVGMSFFSDPVSAFRNLGSALGDRGRMAFVSWAGVDRNPWFHIPKQAAERRLGPAPKADPRAPGPTAFQDIGYVTGLMSQAGLTGIHAQAVEVDLTPPGGTTGAARAASRVGPAARIMKAHKGNEADAAAIEEAVRDAFVQFETNGGTRVPAVVNLFTCRT